MALRESIAAAIDSVRTHPELLLLGCAIGVLQALLFGGFEFVVTTTLPVRGLATVVSLSALLAVLPLFVALYELVLRPDPDEPVAASLRRAVGSALRRYPRVLLTDAAAGVASLTAGLLVGVGWYVVATGGRYVRYVTSDAGVPRAFETVYLVGVTALLGALLASFAVRFADVLTAFHDDGAVSAVTRSVIVARRNVRSFVGFTALLLAIQLLSVGAVAGVSEFATIGTRSLPVLVGGGLLLILLNGMAITLTGTLHATFFTHHFTPASPPQSVPSPHRSVSVRNLLGELSLARWTVAIVCVLGLVAGAATVRTLDVGVYNPSEPRPIASEDPNEAVETAVANTRSRSHRRVLFLRNASDPESSYRVSTRTGVDYADRQLYVYFVTEDGETFGGFYGEGTMGLLRSGGRFSGPVAYRAGNWSVAMLPGTGITEGGDSIRSGVVPAGPTSGWTVVESNESVLVVRLSDPLAIPEALGPRGFGGETPPLAPESHVTVAIDRERGVLDEVRMHLHSRETGRDVRYRLVYHDVGGADLRRPAPFRDRRVLEHVWDAMYY